MTGKRYKAIVTDWQDLQLQDDSEIIHVCLTQRKAALVKSLISTAYWQTRWANTGSASWDEIEAFVAEIDSLLSGNDCEVGMNCDDVAACINDSETVQDALLDYNVINTNTGGAGNYEKPLPDSVLAEEMLPLDFSCDNDHRYGTAVGVVEAIHSATLEVFQAIELLTNAAELAAEIADNMTLVELATSGLDVIVWIQNTIYETYNSAYSPTVVDTISCEIYCRMLPHDPCHLDFDMIWDTYTEDLIDILTPPPLSASWVDWFAWLVEMTVDFALDATNVVKAGSLLGLLIMRYGGGFGQFVMGIRTLKTTIALLADDTNPDWALLCLDCPTEWEHVFNFETHSNAWADGGFDIAPPLYGSYVVGTGVVDELWSFGGDTNYNGFAGIKFGLTVPNSSDKWTMYCRIERGAFALNPEAFRMRADPYPIGTWSQAHILTGDKKFSLSWDGNDVTNMTCGACVSSISPDGPYGTIVCVAVSLSGTGGDPFAALDTGIAPF